MLISFLCYGVAFMCGLFIIRRETPLYIGPTLAIILSFWGHILGTYYYSLSPSDSTEQFFPLASPEFTILGTHFVENLVWYVRYFFTGDSLITTFYFFSSFSFLGGILWYAVYLKCARQLNIRNPSAIWPALILMCWPSALIFTAGIGKDSLCYFFIPLVFLSCFNLFEKKALLLNIIIFFISLIMLMAIRPYLLLIFIMTFTLYTSRGWRIFTLKNIFSWIIMLLGAAFSIYWVLITQGGFSSIDVSSIADKAMLQQDLQAQGTHFEMPSSNSFVRILLFPYSFLMNLCFPIFYLARNMEGYLTSIENLFLVYLIWKTLHLRNLVKQFFLQNRKPKLLLYFFMLGMFFLAIGNTNLGLAVRQKTMYLPAFLVIYCLLYTVIRKKKTLKQ